MYALAVSNFIPDSHYLEDAFLISEKNKASVMASQFKGKKFSFFYRVTGMELCVRKEISNSILPV